MRSRSHRNGNHFSGNGCDLGFYAVHFRMPAGFIGNRKIAYAVLLRSQSAAKLSVRSFRQRNAAVLQCRKALLQHVRIDLIHIQHDQTGNCVLGQSHRNTCRIRPLIGAHWENESLLAIVKIALVDAVLQNRNIGNVLQIHVTIQCCIQRHPIIVLQAVRFRTGIGMIRVVTIAVFQCICSLIIHAVHFQHGKQRCFNAGRQPEQRVQIIERVRLRIRIVFQQGGIGMETNGQIVLIPVRIAGLRRSDLLPRTVVQHCACSAD